MRFLLRVAACLFLVLAVSGLAALAWDRSDAAAAHAAHPQDGALKQR